MAPTIILKEVNPEKLPVSHDEISEIIEKYKETIGDKTPKQLIQTILDFLCSKSSKYKYLVTAHKIEGHGESDLQVNTGFGASWDDANDGMLTVRADLGEDPAVIKWIVVTVIFITGF